MAVKTILIISLEKRLLSNNAIRERIFKQFDFAEKAVFIVFAKKKYNQKIGKYQVISTNSINKFFYVFDAWRILFKLKAYKFDVILSQDVVETGLVAYLAHRKFNCALALQDHGYIFHGKYYQKESFLNFFRVMFANWLIKQAQAIRVVSLRTENILKTKVNQQKIICFPLSVSKEILSCNLIKKTIAKEQYFLLVARFVPIKRIDLAIHAFSLIAKRYPQIKLKIIGDGFLKKEIEKQIKVFNLQKQVELIPWQNDLRLYYQGALATLITSDREGFGMTAVESLLCQTPVIMTNIGCAYEVVQNDVNGYIVPIGDVTSIAQKMEILINNPNILNKGIESFKWANKDKMLELLELAKFNYLKKNNFNNYE